MSECGANTGGTPGSAQGVVMVRYLIALLLLLGIGGCSNSPFPRQNETYRVRYKGYVSPPKTLDPAVGYTAGMGTEIRGSVHESLLEYHYLKRPYELIPGLAENVPEAVDHPDGTVSYRFTVRRGVPFHEDPCFELSGEGVTARDMTARDFEFEFKRIADPDVMCPVIVNYSNIRGLRSFGKRLVERREADEAFAGLPVNQQYDQVGAIEGVVVHSPYELELVLDQAYPQILYWLAMPFSAAVPWEAVVYYDGKEGRDVYKEHPVGTGPYYLAVYDPGYRGVLERNKTWYGFVHPEWKAPGTVYPTEGEPGDAEQGLLDPEYVGTPLARIERFEYRREKESLSAFSKFLQGYYDASGITKERFDSVVEGTGLSADMQALGIRLVKSVEPTISYMGFNMNDPVLGHAAGERGRTLRQAMSLVIDVEEYKSIFTNGRGIPAQSPVPPGIFGYDPQYRNPMRTPDPARARELLVEAGYPGGVDPQTKRPLRLTFDVGGTSSERLMAYGFYTDAWRSIGLDVEVAATDYNQFSKKVRTGAYQIFVWGWNADYPDPENFLFLLSSEMSRAKSNGPNSANYASEAYDQLFHAMQRRDNDAQRLRICNAIYALLEQDCPWIPLMHRERFGLYHRWLKNVKPGGVLAAALKYEDIDPAARHAYQLEHNAPIMWPLYVIILLLALLFIPAIITFYRERQ